MNVQRYQVKQGKAQQIPAIGSQGRGVYLPSSNTIQFWPDDVDQWPCDPDEFGGYIMAASDMAEIG